MPERSRQPTRIALFTDTLGDVNGVSRFVLALAAHAGPDRPLHVLTSTRFPCLDRPNIHNLPPLLARPMPGYPTLDIVLPDARALRRRADDLHPTIVHVSTPGPVGLLGRRYALARSLPLVATYHTDFPAYIAHLFDDDALAWAAARFLLWFYRPFPRILARSADGARSMLRLGIPPDRVVPLTPGIDTDAFHPRFRDPDGTLRRILPVLRERSVKVLYVGRLSVEKNLPFLARVWPRIRCAADAQLLIVGDGPYRAAMQRDLARHDAHFLGFRHASELSALYASADLFLFPSATDTLGQAVLEAQSSGLPAIVSDRGGPCEFVVHETTGLVLPAPPAHDAEDRWIAGAQRLIADPVLRARMALAARAAIAPRTFARSFDRFWSVHRGASEHELT